MPKAQRGNRRYEHAQRAVVENRFIHSFNRTNAYASFTEQALCDRYLTHEVHGPPRDRPYPGGGVVADTNCTPKVSESETVRSTLLRLGTDPS